MNKLLRLYGDTMCAISFWFMKRGENYATWIEFKPSDYGLDDEQAKHCGCAECE